MRITKIFHYTEESLGQSLIQFIPFVETLELTLQKVILISGSLVYLTFSFIGNMPPILSNFRMLIRCGYSGKKRAEWIIHLILPEILMEKVIPVHSRKLACRFMKPCWL